VPSYFGQSTLTTQPSHPSGSSAVADNVSLPIHRQSSAATAAMTLPLHMDTRSATVHVAVATPTCTQPLHPSGLSTAGAPALTNVSNQPTLVPTTHDLVDLTQHSAPTADSRMHSVYTLSQSTLSAAAVQPCTTALSRLVEAYPPRQQLLVPVAQSVCTPVAQTQLMYNPVRNIVGDTPQASTLASGVTVPQSLDVPVQTQVAHIATGSDVQPSLTPHTAGIDTQL